MYEQFDPLRRSHLKPRFVQNGLSVLSEVFRILIEINEQWKYLSMNHSRLQRCANCLQVVCKAYANYMLILAQLTRPAKQEPDWVSKQQTPKSSCTNTWPSSAKAGVLSEGLKERAAGGALVAHLVC